MSQQDEAHGIRGEPTRGALAPLVARLRDPAAVTAVERFACGALWPGGWLDLSRRGLAPADARALVERALASPHVASVLLGGNDLGDAGAAAVADALARPGCALRGLDLSANAVSDAGARALAAALRDNDVLEALDLSDNALGPDGLAALLDAAASHRALAVLRLARGAPPVDPARWQAVMARLCANANARRGRGAPAWLSLPVRAAPAADPHPPGRDAPATPAPTEAPFTAEQLAHCLEVLAALEQRPELLEGHRDDPALGTLARMLARHVRRRGARAAERAPPDGPRVTVVKPPSPEPVAPARALEAPRRRRCYVCKRGADEFHAMYPALCVPCGEFNLAKRGARADLRGRVALVTGARLKIGYHTALRLLRNGATVLALTRFPRDAARRYAAEPDFDAFRDRLRVYGLDLRHVRGIERFTDHLAASLARLDVVVNNAAQTVQRPPAFYATLREIETRPADALPAAWRSVLADWTAPSWRGELFGPGGAPATLARGAPATELDEPDALAHRDEDDARGGPGGGALADAAWALDAAYGAVLFPRGSDDGYGQPLDLRPTNSWRLRAGEVSTLELLEVHTINTLAPFLLVNRLRGLMASGPPADRYVVNVSAVEGQFYRRNKPTTHPHTNMAKAALNMLTRTSAPDFARDRIFMNSVDTGWIHNQNPHPLAARMDAHGFRAPLDETDAAARVCDPIFTGVTSGAHVCGAYLKDYRPAPW